MTNRYFVFLKIKILFSIASNKQNKEPLATQRVPPLILFQNIHPRPTEFQFFEGTFGGASMHNQAILAKTFQKAPKMFFFGQSCQKLGCGQLWISCSEFKECREKEKLDFVEGAKDHCIGVLAYGLVTWVVVIMLGYL